MYYSFKNFELLKRIDDSEIKGIPYLFYNNPTDSIKYGIKLIPIIPDEPNSFIESELITKFNETGLIHIPFLFKTTKMSIFKSPIKDKHNFRKLYKEEEVLKDCVVLVTEYLHGGPLDEFILKIKEILETTLLKAYLMKIVF